MDTKQITEYLDSLIDRGIPSVDCVVTENHKELYHHFNGTRFYGKDEPLCGNERYLMFSMTKVQTMTAILQLVERGLLSLEDEVSRYLPAYKDLLVEEGGVVRPLKQPLRLWHLVSMQSGLDYDLNRTGIIRTIKAKGQAATTREIVDSFVETPLHFTPGTRFCYSLSHDVCAAIIEVVSGMRFSEYLRKNIWEPLHRENTFFAKPMNAVDRLVTQYICGEGGRIVPMESSCNYQLTESYESGGAGLISCTADYAVLADTLACGGMSADGVRILRPETVELIKKNLLSEKSMEDLRTSMGRIGYGYGCGMQVLLYPEHSNSSAPVGVFGWDGAAGSCIQMDTASKRSFVFLMHVRNCGIAYSEFHVRLRDMIFG